MATGTTVTDPDYRYWQNIETGAEIEVIWSSYEERDTNYYEENFVCESLGEEWQSEAEMEAWMKDNGYTDDY